MRSIPVGCSRLPIWRSSWWRVWSSSLSFLIRLSARHHAQDHKRCEVLFLLLQQRLEGLELGHGQRLRVITQCVRGRKGVP